MADPTTIDNRPVQGGPAIPVTIVTGPVQGGPAFPVAILGQISQLLDLAFSAVQGSILYRGASAWAAQGPGTAGQVLTTNGAGANPTWAVPAAGGTSYAIIADQKTAGVNGGTFTQDAWQTRDINTEVADPDGIVSIAGNQFVLGAGTYRVSAYVPAIGVRRVRARLYNISDSVAVQYSESAYVLESSIADSQYIQHIFSRFTIAANKTFEIQQYCQLTSVSIGFGAATDIAIPGLPYEQYTTVIIEKE